MGRERHETQHGASLAAHGHGVVEVELVEIDGYAGQRAYKPIGQQGDIVLENVDFAHEVVKHLLDVLLVDVFIDAGATGAQHEALVHPAVAAVVVAGNGFLDAHGQDALAGEQRRVGIFLNPSLFLSPAQGLADDFIQVAQAEHHALIQGVAVMRQPLRVVVVTVGTQPPDHVHCGIILLAVFLFSLLDDHLVEFYASGHHVDDHHTPLPRLDLDFSGAITHGRDAQPREPGACGNGKSALVGSKGSLAGAHQGNRCIGNTLTGHRVPHEAGDLGHSLLLTCRCQRSQHHHK